MNMEQKYRLLCGAKSKAFWWGFHVCGRRKNHLGKHTCHEMIERIHQGSRRINGAQKRMAPQHCNHRWESTV